MAPDDRDRTFEKALARHLRYVAPSSEDDASLNFASLPCPDPEILAAYHDGSLNPDERTLWKQHVLGCDRCQLVLEHLATPLDVGVNVSSDMVRSEERVVAVSQSTAPQAPASTRKPRLAPRRNYFWWLVPTGAVAAAGLVAFIVLRPAKPISAPQSSSVEMARSQEPSRPQTTNGLPLPPKTEPPIPSAATKAKERDAFAVGGASPRATDNKDLKDLREEAQLAKKLPELSKTAPSPNALYEAGKRESGNVPAASGGGVSNEKQDQLQQQVAALDAEMKKQGVAQQQTPSSVVGGQAGYLANNSIGTAARAKAAAPQPPTAPTPAETRGDALSSVPPAAAESVEISAQPQLAARMRASRLESPRVFGARGGKVLWRVGPGGSLERSTNTGKDWTAQASGVNTDLLAGSAPSAKVCWIIGTSGTILRTTDGGAHWTKLNPPAPGELAGIKATDALHAQIRFAADSGTGLAPSYQTSDGGLTWIAGPQD